MFIDKTGKTVNKETEKDSYRNIGLSMVQLYRAT